jgi:putative transposase
MVICNLHIDSRRMCPPLRSKLLKSRKPGHLALRRGRHSIPGQHYLVTFVTHKSQAFFSDHALAMQMAREINDPRSWKESRLLAWVLMPDHWHGLIELGEHESLSALMRSFKANISRRVRLSRPGAGPLWGKSFHDRAVRSDEDAIDAARYIIMNPVRAGLVRRIGDYPFWNAVWV